jgi:hypothetical protein
VVQALLLKKTLIGKSLIPQQQRPLKGEVLGKSTTEKAFQWLHNCATEALQCAGAVVIAVREWIRKELEWWSRPGKWLTE